MLAVMVQKPGRKSKHSDDDICLLVQTSHVLFTTLVGPTAGMQTAAGRISGTKRLQQQQNSQQQWGRQQKIRDITRRRNAYNSRDAYKSKISTTVPGSAEMPVTVGALAKVGKPVQQGGQ